MHRPLAQPRRATMISRSTPTPRRNPTTRPDPSLPGPVPADEIDLGPLRQPVRRDHGDRAGQVGRRRSRTRRRSTPAPTPAGVEDDRRRRDTGRGCRACPQRWVNSIIVDPDNADHAYVAFSGFREGDDAANVWETHDGGATWANISQNLPNGPVEMIEYDARHDVLFAATDVGVFDHKDGDATGTRSASGCRTVPVLDVKLSGDGKTCSRRRSGARLEAPLSTDATDGGGAGAAAPCRRRWR